MTLSCREPTALESIASKLTSQLQRSSFATGLSGSRISGGQVKVDNSAIASDDDEVPEQTKENDMDEAITWAGWDELDGKRLLVLAYRLGLQIWDATSLDTLHEITNIKDSSLGSVKFATVLPAPSKGGHDHYADARPLLALLTVPEGQSETEFMVYSLATRSAVLNISFPRAGVISANESFVVIVRVRYLLNTV